jgi:phosphohistidine phosphatase SixA
VAAKVQKVNVTDVRRTQQTAEPLPEQLHVEPIVIAKADVSTRRLGNSKS